MLSVELIRSSDLWPPQAELYAFATRLLKPIEDSLYVYYPNWQSTNSELSLVFTNNQHIAQLNASWRGLDKPTNVLSFPASALKIGETPGPMLGDIIFALETIEQQAVMQNKNFYHHLAHLFSHGFLHLLGFDHNTEEEAETMEQLECEILAKLQIPNPYISNI